MKVDEFSSLVGTFYEASLNPTLWPRVARLCAQALGSESCAIFSADLARGASGVLGSTENFDAKAIGDYKAYWHQKDIVAMRMAQSGSGQAMLSTEVVREAEFRESEIFNDYCKPMRLGFYWAVGSVFPLEKQVMGGIGIHRPRGSPAFDSNAKHALSLLLPHLSRAMLLQQRLEGATLDHQLALETLNRLEVAMIVVDARANLLFANSLAECLLRADLGLTCHLGRIGATDQEKEDELRRLIQQAGMASLGRPSEPGGVMAIPRAEGRSLSLLISPLPPRALDIGPSVPAALIIFGDPEVNLTTTTQALIELYGLTRAEAKLLNALIEGERLENYADRQQISIHTARTQSKQIFAKTGHGRQADIIREVLANPALRAIHGTRNPRKK